MSIIGLSSINYFIDKKVNVRMPFSYVNCVKNCGGIPVVIPVIDDDNFIEKILTKIDGLIIPGGDDINPNYFNELLSPYTKGVDDLLDRFQIKLIQKALKKDLPVLGICRGHQVLNVALAGTLYQDISEYKVNINIIHDQLHMGYNENEKVHEVTFKKGSILEQLYGERLMTNSFHHQVVKNLGLGLESIGKTKDGVIEAIVSKDHRFVLSVQWHPERSIDYYPLFKLFVDTCKAREW